MEAGEEEEQTLLTAARAAAAQAGPNVGPVNASFELPEASSLAPFLEKVHIAMDALLLVKATAEFLSQGKSDAATAGKKIGAATSGGAAATGMASGILGLAGAGASLVTSLNAVALEMNFYIVPVTEACLKALEKLEDVGRDINKDAMERGDYDHVNWELEPGGRAMFDFMRSVMAAGSAEEVPKPVPSTVAKYVVANREEIAKGAAGNAEGENEVPTTGFWFWRKLDEGKIAEWVFTHRSNLWAIFYGSTKPGANT
jgi:hypothetical protein